jgi:DNA polymerase elongation subunit (family B)
VFAQAIDLWFEERLKAKAKASAAAKKAKAETDPVKKATYELEFAKWNTKQMAFKIFMNSAYGASASRFFIFYDPRLGKSITLSGRVITKHMVRQVCKETSGNYDFDRNVLIYGDTDSCYFRLDWYLKEKLGLVVRPEDLFPKTPFMDKVVKIANDLTDKVNATFPGLLADNFFCDETNRKFILAVRDIVAIRGLFKEQKKKYALWAIMQEDKPTDEVKIVGMETKRTNTPKYMQVFLEDLITRILKENLDYDQTYAIVDEFRSTKFRAMDPWKHGSSMSVKNIGQIQQAMDEYETKTEAGHIGLKKPTSSAAVPAALNTNKLIQMHGEDRWGLIREGDSVEFLYLLPNDHGFKTIALPVGATYIPEWFKHLPFDVRRNQDKILENALENTVGEVLDWDMTAKKNNAAEVFVEKDFFA